LVNLAKKESLVLVPSGKFLMGSPDDEVGRGVDEKLSEVEITQAFWIKKFEVTRAEWNEFLPESRKIGSLVYALSSKSIETMCGSSGYTEGNFSIAQNFEGDSTDISLTEAVFAQGSWNTAKKPRKYKVKGEKFKDMQTLQNFLKSQNIKTVGRLDQMLPLTHVSYSQVVAFCWEKTQRERLSKNLPSPFVYRLPTEAEWEYACRAGTSGICGIGEGNYLSGENANIDGSKRGYVIDQRPKTEFSLGSSFTLSNREKLLPLRDNTHPYLPNSWGLYDMHGSVMEWCYDFYGPYPDDDLTRIDPIGPIRGSRRIVRGGSFIRTAHLCRSATRWKYEASYRGDEIGFRYVLGLPLR
jgi:formylglycine-generating enzyme required for sulfatase activity